MVVKCIKKSWYNNYVIGKHYKVVREHDEHRFIIFNGEQNEMVFKSDFEEVKSV